MEPCGLPGLLVFVGENLERTWNELRREHFLGGDENGGVDAAQQTKMKKYTMLR